MTANDPATQSAEPARAPRFAAAGRLIRPLSWLAAATICAAATIFLLSTRLPWLAALQLTGPATGALLLAALGLTACLCAVLARRPRFAAPQGSSTRSRTGYAATAPQILLALFFTAAAAAAILNGWPRPPAGAATASGSFAVASALLLLATPWLMTERYFATVPPEALPEVRDLRALLFLPVICFGAEAVLQVADWFGFASLDWPRVILSAGLLLICAEVALGALATWFLPPRDSATARAPIKSRIAGLLRGHALTPAAMATMVRSQFGMDFSRSWALRFIQRAAIPVLLLMFAFCWFLTGVTRVDLNQRGSYERFGIAASMLPPGLHLGLPWPFGAVRHVELGVIHTVSLSFDDQGGVTEIADASSAEGDAPASANRLWDKEQPSDVSYVVASQQQDRQSFQTVSVNAGVQYRIGLSDAAGYAALYREAAPDVLVRVLASRMLTQFFAAHTLPEVLGDSQAVIATDVRTRLQQALDGIGTGIEIVAVVIEAIHPPSGAATAYRNVQAAEIEATTAIATERGRAQTTASVALLDARDVTDDASAAAAETVSAARADLIAITADDRPYRTASQPFLLERYFSDVKSALTNVPLVVVDHRVGGPSPPTIDLRPPGTARDVRPNASAAKGNKAAAGDNVP